MGMQTKATHYRWADVEQDHPIERIARQRIVGERVMLSRFELQRGCHVATHRHENEQIACVLSGKLRFGIGPDDSAERYELTLGAGEVLHFPSNVPHSADALEDSVVLDIFSPPASATGVDRR